MLSILSFFRRASLSMYALAVPTGAQTPRTHPIKPPKKQIPTIDQYSAGESRRYTIVPSPLNTTVGENILPAINPFRIRLKLNNPRASERVPATIEYPRNSPDGKFGLGFGFMRSPVLLSHQSQIPPSFDILFPPIGCPLAGSERFSD